MSKATFTVATWNVFNDTPPERLPRILKALTHNGVSIILGQEFTNPINRQVLRDSGWEVFFHGPQWVVAWQPEVWVQIGTNGVRLAQTSYQNKRGHEFHSDAAMAILSDRVGRTLTAASYHLPSNVQVANQLPRRMQTLRESAEGLKALADLAQTRAFLSGGDDNVDERLNHGPWDFLLGKATGLKQVQAPEATHGRTRKIDDFRVRGLKPLDGLVIPGGGDHKIHVREFGWAR